jgi:hypothetical protein
VRGRAGARAGRRCAGGSQVRGRIAGARADRRCAGGAQVRGRIAGARADRRCAGGSRVLARMAHMYGLGYAHAMRIPIPNPAPCRRVSRCLECTQADAERSRRVGDGRRFDPGECRSASPRLGGSRPGEAERAQQSSRAAGRRTSGRQARPAPSSTSPPVTHRGTRYANPEFTARRAGRGTSRPGSALSQLPRRSVSHPRLDPQGRRLTGAADASSKRRPHRGHEVRRPPRSQSGRRP